MVESLFRFPVVAEIATALDYEAELFPEELIHAAGMSPRRRREFSAGRSCARRALARLGWPDTSIPMGTRREPVWPPGVHGSIAHCAGFCAVVVARGEDALAIGIDAEPVGSVKGALVAEIASAEETGPTGSEDLPADKGTILFVTKEAAFKALFLLMHQELEFLDLRVDPTRWPDLSVTLRPGFSNGMAQAVGNLRLAGMVRDGIVVVGAGISGAAPGRSREK